MIRNKIINALLLGFFSWLVPFGVSFIFYSRGGVLMIPYDLFKSIMIVTASATWCYFLNLYFRSIDRKYVFYAVIVGIVWVLINLILDFFLLLPFMKTSYMNYFSSIGLEYFVIPLISISMGFLLERKKAK